MQYDVETAAEYVEALDDDWRKEKLLALRSMILSKAPDLMESIEYKMLRYGISKTSLFHLNAQRNYVSLYVGNIKKIDASGTLLEGLDVGKGCIRFKKSVSIPDTGIEEFIDRTISMWKNNKDTSC